VQEVLALLRLLLIFLVREEMQVMQEALATQDKRAMMDTQATQEEEVRLETQVLQVLLVIAELVGLGV
jgi:hypothetical protein